MFYDGTPRSASIHSCASSLFQGTSLYLDSILLLPLVPSYGIPLGWCHRGDGSLTSMLSLMSVCQAASICPTCLEPKTFWQKVISLIWSQTFSTKYSSMKFNVNLES